MLQGRSAGQLVLRGISAVQPVISITANYRTVKSRNAGGIGRAVDNGAIVKALERRADGVIVPEAPISR